MRNTVVILLAVLALAGCSGKTPVAQTGPESVQHTAGAIANAMSLGTVTVWTADTDPNKLLGRTGGYTSAATIADTRITCTERATDCGATIEVYPTADEALARSQYIQAILGNGGVLGTEYHYFEGTALLRVTGQLTPDQAKVYATQFQAASK